MIPAVSLIVFSALSGLGFGMMVWLGLGYGPQLGWHVFLACALALGAAAGGLVASLWHLGSPARARFALSQWRSSWMSREGVAAGAALGVFALYAALWVLGGLRIGWLGWLSAILAALTVLTTSMIYTQLRTIPRWNTPLTPVKFLLFAGAGSALMLGLGWAALILLIALGVVLVLHWQAGDGVLAKRLHSVESATGLGRLGRTRAFEPPHTGPNYLMREMMFRVGRKRAEALRRVALGAAVVIPALLVLIAILLGAGWWLYLVAFLVHALGTVAARWLFLAEAEHVVSLYYPAG